MTTLVKPVVAQGKTLLIRAALKLAMKTRSIRALGVREIGREAGLNPNTFYRHFSSMDDLGLALLNLVVSDLRKPLRELRKHAAVAIAAEMPVVRVPGEYWAHSLRKAKRVAYETIRLYFEFVLKQPEAFAIGISELHGSSPLLRQAVQQVIADLASDLADDIRIFQLLPMLSDTAVQEISNVIIGQVFSLSTEYIEGPEQREEMIEMAYQLVLSLIAGAIALEVRDEATLNELVGILRDES